MIVAIVIGAVVALVAVQWVIGSLTSKATNAASRSVFSKKYEAGRDQMHRTLRFTALVSVSAASDSIVKSVNAFDTAPPVVGGLYLFQRSETLLVFAVGNKLNTAFRARVDLTPTDGGVSGTYRMVDWKESGANVMGSASVDKLVQRITDAVTQLGGTVTEGSAR